MQKTHYIFHSCCLYTLFKVDISILVRIPSVHHYYFHFSSQSSLSSSSFFSSLLSLSYCEHQQTTYYSSSGFVILRSSPRFFLPDIVNSQQSSSFHHRNAVLSVVDQSLSTSIVTLMSSKENNPLLDIDTSNLTTTINPSLNSISSLLSTTTTTTTTVSLSTTQRGNRTFNIALIIGCISASIILIIIIIYAFVKYRNRDEGSYKIDESKNFVANSTLDNHDNSAKTLSSNHHRQKLLTTNAQNGVDSREWYV
jgi:hypothetical protein